MRTISCFTVTALLVLIAFHTAWAERYYYGGGSTIPLQIDSNRVTFRFDENIASGQQASLMVSIGRFEEEVQDSHAIHGFVVCSLTTSQGYDEFIDSLAAIPEIELVEPYYRDEYDSAMLVGYEFIVAFDEALPQAEVDSIINSYHVIVARPVDSGYLPNAFVLRNTRASGKRTLDLANELYELETTRYSHPIFGIRPVLSGYSAYDFYADFQPYTKKVIGQFNQASVWDFYGMNEPVTVAILDDGVAAHEDLPLSRLIAGYDFVGDFARQVLPDNDPTPGPYRAHGMGCAGIIGASHTTAISEGQEKSSGVISLNPYALIMPVKVFDDRGRGTFGPDAFVRALRYVRENGADVVSSSWNFPSVGLSYDVLNDAIERTFLYGREGKGCPVIYSSGNYATIWSGELAYPADHPSVLAVGATDLSDSRWYYSMHGVGLDLVAPSGDREYQGDVWTLDQMGVLGINPQFISNCPPSSNDVDYDCAFGGTSGAAPVVSGVAALLLAKMPNLSSAAVYDILRNSAVRDLDWGTIAPPNSQYGYGRVDAFRAILSISRGDANNDGITADIADILYLVAYSFQSPEGPAPFPSELLGDANCDGYVDVSDINYMVEYALGSYPAPAPINPCYEFGD